MAVFWLGHLGRCFLKDSLRNTSVRERAVETGRLRGRNWELSFEHSEWVIPVGFPEGCVR